MIEVHKMNRGVVRAASLGKDHHRIRQVPEMMFDASVQILVRSPSQALPMKAKLIIKMEQEQAPIEEEKIEQPA